MPRERGNPMAKAKGKLVVVEKLVGKGIFPTDRTRAKARGVPKRL